MKLIEITHQQAFEILSKTKKKVKTFDGKNVKKVVSENSVETIDGIFLFNQRLFVNSLKYIL